MSRHMDELCLGAKIALRSYFLQKYHSEGKIWVMDCFAGPEGTWNRLKEMFDIDRYWGIDLKSKPGRLMLDSARILKKAGWTENVVDLDAYGSPWKHWRNMLRTAKGPKTVFLTVGVMKKAGGGSNYEKEVKAPLGIPEDWTLPASLGSSLAAMSVSYAIHQATDLGWWIRDVKEAWPQAGARYLGVRIEPQ